MKKLKINKRKINIDIDIDKIKTKLKILKKIVNKLIDNIYII
jgi:hypothetical protein